MGVDAWGLPDFDPNMEALMNQLKAQQQQLTELAKQLAELKGGPSVLSSESPNASANTNRPTAAGDKMIDGTVYAGISPDTGKNLYAAPADAPLMMTFNEAADYENKLCRENYLGHDDWRVPTKDELNVLFNSRAAIGGFNVTGLYPASRYWSVTPTTEWYTWCQRFSDGAQGISTKDDHLSLRPVRTEAPKLP